LRPALRARQRQPVRACARGEPARARRSGARRRRAGGPRARPPPRRSAHAPLPRRARDCVNVVVLTGGVGGARFLRGVVEAVDPASVTAIVNVGDDLEVLGLYVSPDLDSVLYALAGLGDEERGWGRAEETWNALAAAAEFG